MASAIATAGRGAALPVVASVIFVAGLAIVLVTGASAGTLGYDFEAYAQAAQRLIDGLPLYDTGVDLAGGFAIFLYPPPFAIAFVPFALLGSTLGLWAWTAVLVGCVVAAAGLMPVSTRTRWVVLLLAGLHWPTLYAIRLGQVGPILLLLFVIGWRWLVRPGSIAGPLGATVGLGAIIKIQPGLLGVWALLTGRWRDAVVAGVVVVAGSLVTLPIVGLAAWGDYLALLGRVSEPITTPHNFTPGAVLFQAGMAADVATLFQWGVVVASLGIVVLTIRLRSAEASYLVAVVASQLVSPLLWDHYAVILLAPVAWLLQRRAWWVLPVPVAMAWPLVGVVPAAVYPLAFLVMLVAPLAMRRSSDAR